jgi:hypothetical protein
LDANIKMRGRGQAGAIAHCRADFLAHAGARPSLIEFYELATFGGVIVQTGRVLTFLPVESRLISSRACGAIAAIETAATKVAAAATAKSNSGP